ncbi:sulfotransferase family protein [Gelidibacter japonicus]|uniref:sulfotransferase family protein n=1 Tax=Gelidibacter japonicus TaxID=1962232 RepID=UPI003A8ECADB
MNGENLIFIISQPRAGSTLLQSLLSNNEEVNTVSEPWLLLALAPLLKPSLAITNYDYGLCHDALREYEKKFPSAQWVAGVKQLASQIYAPLFDGGYRYIIDKTPRYYEILDMVLELFPKAHFIFIKRNPIDVVVSLIRKRSITKASDLLWNNRDLLNAPYLIQEFLETHSKNSKVLSLNYETLVEEPEKVLSDLYERLGISFSTNVLQLDKNDKTVGKYGDPNIQKTTHAKIQSTKDAIVLSKEMEHFLKGYAAYLGAEFLESYGNYGAAAEKSKATKVFAKFLTEAEKQNAIFKESIYQKHNPS